MQAKQKKLKGMTLIEIVISMAIYGMIAMLITEVMCLVNATMRSTQQLNTRLSYEAKFADNLMTVDTSTGSAFPSGAVGVHIKEASGAFSEITGTNAFEYETQYSGTSSGVQYHENTNYKFMTFTKVSAAAQEKPDGAFILEIVLNDADAASIDHIVIDGDMDDGSSQQIIYKSAQSGGSFSSGQTLLVDLNNNAPAGSSGTTSQTVTVTVFKEVIAPTSGANLGVQRVSQTDFLLYTCVDVAGFPNYNNVGTVTYNGSSWAGPVTRLDL